MMVSSVYIIGCVAAGNWGKIPAKSTLSTDEKYDLRLRNLPGKWGMQIFKFLQKQFSEQISRDIAQTFNSQC